MTMSDINPHLVTVEVKTTYLPSHSDPDEDHYTFAYTITISNHADVTVQLLSRHWLITDANNQVQEVRGEGVVGEQPVIAPGEQFRYTSGATLPTPVGYMRGSYQMVVHDADPPGERFEVPIPPFSLHMPHALH
jgi:ApaG protein